MEHANPSGLRWRTLLLGAVAMLSLLASALVPVGAGAQNVPHESCPAGNPLLASFRYEGGRWAPVGDSNGVQVSGSSRVASFVSSSRIAAVVVRSGHMSVNYVYDPNDTSGTLNASSLQPINGANLSGLDFCAGHGAVPPPSSGSRVSIDIEGAAGCAMPNRDGTATLTGTVMIRKHSPKTTHKPVATQVLTAEDTIFRADDGAQLAHVSLPVLMGRAIPQSRALKVNYSVTFDPRQVGEFSNRVQVTIGQSASGLERHKFYSTWSNFSMCSQSSALGGGGADIPSSMPSTGGGGASMPRAGAPAIAAVGLTGVLSALAALAWRRAHRA